MAPDSIMNMTWTWTMGMAGGMATACNLYVRRHGTSWLMYFLSSPASVAGSSGFAAKSEKPISEHLVRVG